MSSTYTLNNSAFKNPAQTACGDGIYGLLTDGLAWVNAGWHGATNLYSGPEALQGATPPGGGTVLYSLQLKAGKAAAAAAKAHKGKAAAASAAAARGNAAVQTDALASAKAAKAAMQPPAMKAVALPRHK